MENHWRQVLILGTELDMLDTVYQCKWSFSNLEHAFEEGGELYDKRVYMFGCIEIQLVEENITVFPVMIAVVSPVPPSDKIGMRSSYKEPEEIVSMEQLKMDWVPYSPLEPRGWPREPQPQIFILSCTGDALQRMKLEQWEKFKYCLPYLEWPLREDDIEECKEVEIHYPPSNKPHQVTILFHWQSDNLEETIDKLIADNKLPADEGEPFKDFVEKKDREAKEVHHKAREPRFEDVDEAFRNMTFYKYYPAHTPDTPDLSYVKSPYINRYYGNAHMVF